MSKDYIHQSDAQFLQQLIAFNTNVVNYVSELGLSTDQIASSIADEKEFAWVTACLEIMRNANTEMTAWRNNSRDGGDNGMFRPKLPVFPPAPPAVAPGIEPRFRAISNFIKASPGYTESMGRALGIIAEAPGPLDLNTVKPSISVIRTGAEVLVRWGWGSNRGALEMCEIHVDRNDGKGFVLLTFDHTPNYIDTHPQPATPTTWTYKAIYRAKDKQVGQWSKPDSVSVGG